MTTILIFDVETTGLLPKTPKAGPYPHILQLCFSLYDTLEKRKIEMYNAFISVPEKVVITPFVSQLTGITRELVEKEGIDIRQALQDFHTAFLKADVLVAHNMQFDMTMLLVESQRFFPLLDMEIQKHQKPLICTMQDSIDICQLECINSRGPYLKFPKLEELYKHLFGSVPENLHDARTDVICCLRCFLKMKMDYLLTDEEFYNLLL